MARSRPRQQPARTTDRERRTRVLVVTCRGRRLPGRARRCYPRTHRGGGAHPACAGPPGHGGGARRPGDGTFDLLRAKGAPRRRGRRSRCRWVSRRSVPGGRTTCRDHLNLQWEGSTPVRPRHPAVAGKHRPQMDGSREPRRALSRRVVGPPCHAGHGSRAGSGRGPDHDVVIHGATSSAGRVAATGASGRAGNGGEGEVGYRADARRGADRGHDLDSASATAPRCGARVAGGGTARRETIPRRARRPGVYVLQSH